MGDCAALPLVCSGPHDGCPCFGINRSGCLAAGLEVGDEWHMTGAIYSLSRATKRAQKPTGEWNTMEIELDGKVTRVRLNGELVNEFKDSLLQALFLHIVKE